MTSSSGYVTLEEITTQTAAWEEAIDVVMTAAPALMDLRLPAQRQVLCTGCGSTYYLALSAAALLQARTGALARALPCSELILHPDSSYVDGTCLLIAISRSGTTSETLRAVADFKSARRGKVVVLTNDSASPLAKLGDLVLAVGKGKEKSVAQTRSFASLHVAAAAVADLLGPSPLRGAYRDALAARGKDLMEKHYAATKSLAEDASIQQVFFLGSGPRYGLASEASLKLKEMSQTVSEPFHFFEFRHGPISMVDPQTLVIGLVSETAFSGEMAVLRNVQELGGRTLAIGEKGTDIAFGSGLSAHVRNVLYLPLLQLLAYHRAVSKARNPDRPRHLAAVVELDLAGLRE